MSDQTTPVLSAQLEPTFMIQGAVAKEVSTPVVPAVKKVRKLKVKEVAVPVPEVVVAAPKKQSKRKAVVPVVVEEPVKKTKKAKVSAVAAGVDAIAAVLTSVEAKAAKAPKAAKNTKVAKVLKPTKASKAVEAEPTEAEIAPVVAATVSTTSTAMNMATAKFSEFRKYLEANPKKYNTLNRYRVMFAPDMSGNGRRKLKLVEAAMQVILDEGASIKRRVPNTGTREEIEAVYKDTASNQKLNRVGQTYKKVIYTNSEFEETKRFKMRRRRRNLNADPNKPVHKNLWIDSIGLAKAELNTPKLVIVRKAITDPADESQVLGNKVYLRAKEIMVAAQAVVAAEKAAVAAAAPVASVEAPVAVTEPVAAS